jgi:anti-sigma B factor antagonist
MNYRIADSKPVDDLVVIELAGEADLMAAPDLRRHVDQAIRHGATRLILDLTDATFVDSTTLGILVSALKRLRPRGGRVAVQCPHHDIRTVFEITGIERMLPVAQTRDEALASITGPEEPAARERREAKRAFRRAGGVRPLPRTNPPIPER